jgi:hypothetical protein
VLHYTLVKRCERCHDRPYTMVKIKNSGFWIVVSVCPTKITESNESIGFMRKEFGSLSVGRSLSVEKCHCPIRIHSGVLPPSF